jgi:hypothetical protein
MHTARLMVEKGSLREPSQDWGTFSFVSLPSPGDRVAAAHEGMMQYLTVICVHHKPMRVGDMARGSEPSADVVAKWTSCEPLEGP